ncbi:hypothetical protein ABD91_21550 [Lysinibacillus sphaericus]|uniref:hypothetical protein n=1 Tax=Lysinibacillus sphaericus TaxID=1421 RepID=UPI0018CD8720|nr:hypothetical protein [Lysinibacillus sphaericus]MBG9693323.1 hypothetical protein [Lysinibacillus sphaericus]
MNCKKCFRCNETYPSDDLTPDGFGDSSVCMCNLCMSELKTDHSRYLLVETPDYCGTTFVLKQELTNLQEYWGKDKVTVLTPIE